MRGFSDILDYFGSFVQARRHGGIWWAYPPQTKLQTPKLKYETL